MINSVVVEGVVIGEPHKEEALEVLSFTVGYERYYKNRVGEEVTEISKFKIVAYGAMSKLTLNDGVRVRLVGRLRQNQWTDKDGMSHSEVQIVAEYIDIQKKVSMEA